MAASPLSPRSYALTAWTGTELLVFRGGGRTTDAGSNDPDRVDGASYDPANDSWRRLAPPPFESRPASMGADFVSAWTGHELIVWGGSDPRAAAYDPTRDRWRPLLAGPLEARVGVASAWTGKELVIFGGQTYASYLTNEDEEDGKDDIPLDTGAAYDPATGLWRRIRPSGAGRAFGVAIWAATEVLVVGGGSGEPGSPTNGRQTLAWNPSADRWRSLATPRFGGVASAVWTGSLVVVAPVGLRESTLHTFDPRSNRWSKSSRPTIPPGFRDRVETLGEWHPTLVWSGREVLVFGSGITDPEDPEPLPGLAFDPAEGAWRTLPASGLARRIGSSAVWTGTELLLWGGAASTGLGGTPYADGARYRPGNGH